MHTRRKLEPSMSEPHPTRGAEDDAIDLLANDQDEIAELFQRYDALAEDGATSRERQALAEELCSLLVVHGAIKEEIFYPAARNRIDEEYLIDEALVARTARGPSSTRSRPPTPPSRDTTPS